MSGPLEAARTDVDAPPLETERCAIQALLKFA